MFFSEAERAFYEDVREKKKAASGVHSKTGKKGYVGKMLFPTDIMSRKDKYNYRKAGKIVSSNLYEKIISIAEFNELEEFEKRNMLAYWRNVYTSKEIKTGMKVSSATYYRIVNELGLPVAPRNNKRRKAKVNTVTIEPKAVAPVAAPVAAPAEPVQEVMVNGIHFVYSGNFSAEHIQNQILKFASILDGEEDEFYIEFKLMQKSKSK
jgi:hypothetical protein